MGILVSPETLAVINEFLSEAAMAVDLARVSDLVGIRALLQSNGLSTEDLEAGGIEAHWVWRTRIALWEPLGWISSAPSGVTQESDAQRSAG